MNNNDIIYISTAAENPHRVFRWRLAIILSAYLAVTSMLAPFAVSSLRAAIFIAVGLISLAASSISAHYFGDKWYIKIIVTAVPIFAAAVMFGAFSRGMLSFFNNIIDLWNSRFASQVPPFAAENDLFGNAVFFSVLFSLAADLISSLGAGKRYKLICLLIFAEFLALSFFRVRISLAAMIFCFAAMLLTWETSVSHSMENTHGMIITAVLAAAAVVGFSILFAPFQGSYTVEMIKDTMIDTYYKARYGNDTLPEGNLHLAYKLLDGDDKRLEIKGDITNELYLGGYVGTDYVPEEGKWEQYGGEVFAGEWSGLFRWLDTQNFHSQFSAAQAIDKSGHTDRECSISVRNLRADRRYLYVPSFLSSINSGRYKLKKDLSVNSRGVFGTNEYTFSFMECDTNAYDIPEITAMGQALSKQNGASDVYGGFVRSVYTRLDKDTEKLLDDIFFSSDNTESETGIYSAVTRIRAVLELRTSYSSSPPIYISGDSEFTDWFLNTAKVGNSVYFATVGTLALRAAGYPARYAEGYYAENPQSDTKEITTKNAHAWSEVYIDHVGWIPVEFTPGYYSETVMGEQTVEISRESAGNGADDHDTYSMTEEYKEQGTEEKPDEPNNSAPAAASVLMIICLTAVIFTAVILVRMRVIKNIRKRRFSQEEPERYIYKHIFRLLALGKVKCDSSRPEECTDTVVKRFSGVRPEEYKRMVQLMQKTVFGNVPLEMFEKRSLRKFCAKLTRILYHTSNPLKRILLRFWYVI
ncbi:MAG: transglutaminase domain-containing protein [Clostridia bacterium]|nr:transglutaminase domain-containing protein [Clostridia bacterium]